MVRKDGLQSPFSSSSVISSCEVSRPNAERRRVRVVYVPGSASLRGLSGLLAIEDNLLLSEEKRGRDFRDETLPLEEGLARRRGRGSTPLRGDPKRMYSRTMPFRSKAQRLMMIARKQRATADGAASVHCDIKTACTSSNGIEAIRQASVPQISALRDG